MSNRTHSCTPRLQLLNNYRVFASSTCNMSTLKNQSDAMLNQIGLLLGTGDWSRHTQIRVQAWLKILERHKHTPLEQQRRNNLLKLLHLMLEFDSLMEPFNKFPSDHENLYMDKHYYNLILEQLSRSIKPRELIKQNTSSLISLDTLETKGHNCEKMEQFSRQDQKYQKILEEKSSKQPKNFLGPLHIRKRSKFRKALNLDATIEETMSGSLIRKNFVQKVSQKAPLPWKKFKSSPKAHADKQNKRQVNLLLGKRENSNSMSQKRAEGNAYWQIFSIESASTPKYLSLYPSHPYVSLAISEQDDSQSHPSSKLTDGLCLCGFLERISQNNSSEVT